MKFDSRLKSFVLNIAAFCLCIGLAIPFGQFIAKVYERNKSHIASGDYRSHVGPTYKLTLYGTTTCEYCIAARTHLRKAGVEFQDVLIDKSKEAERRFASSNQQAVPVLISANEMVVGFDIADFEKIIKRAK